MGPRGGVRIFIEVKLNIMALERHYYTYSFINSETGKEVGWNTEVASSEKEAIDQALARYRDEADETTDYEVDVNSFVRKTDHEAYALIRKSLVMWTGHLGPLVIK